MVEHNEQTLPILETRCDSCNGAGGHVERKKWQRCGSCGGAGYEPTPIGEQILSLMRHNFRLMDRETKEEDI